MAFKRLGVLALLSAAALTNLSCASSAPSGRGYAVASWYGPGFHGKLTSSGEKYNMYAMTCAHKELPLGTRLKVTGVESGKSVDVTVNDRGPFIKGRDIDLSMAAAKEIGIYGPGTGKVVYKVTGYDERYKKYIKRGVSIASPSLSVSLYTIQVGAFEGRENASHIKQGLRFKHDDVHVRRIKVDGKIIFRVRVGKFNTEDSAYSYAQRLADEGYDTLVTAYE